ncbi:alpha-D-ribose 1-methylphosphonate 5-triphosphate diphosphatase [Inquilinus sp. CA228]|uniref:alpha-D-ribose 1-methylphosphonate 5-triphosphate diphosphatase n=1 Tax=Inquilinus sp. CA228 TaxID=3455609 RepID=UPI003F8D8753
MTARTAATASPTFGPAPALTIVGARVLVGGRFEDAVVRIEAGRIAEIAGSEGRNADGRLDGRGRLLLPGIIDLHGDAFERSLMPRPGVRFPTALALDEADRLMAAFGITTALHGVTYSWEPGLRGRDTFLALAETLRALRGRLRCDTHLHLRFEVHNHDGLEEVAPLIADGTIGVVAFNDHLADIEEDLANPEKASRYPGRTGLTIEAFRGLMRRVGGRAAELEATVAALAGMAATAGVPMLSHDDAALETRARYRMLGARIAEFPLTREVAADARAQGEHVVMGGPNVLRGGSHKAGNPSAAELVGAGLCSILTSDYYYPAPLHAVFRLVGEGVLPLERAWDLVAANPAAALGLADRGRIEVGRRADVLLVDPGPDGVPRPDVVANLVEGRRAFVSTV